MSRTETSQKYWDGLTMKGQEQMVLEIVMWGFLSAFGWWGAQHYVIEPYFPPPIDRKKEETK